VNSSEGMIGFHFDNLLVSSNQVPENQGFQNGVSPPNAPNVKTLLFLYLSDKTISSFIKYFQNIFSNNNRKCD
jgi:hypothetical protein